MRCVVQRVKCASVSVDGITVGEIGRGFLVLLGVGAGDDQTDVRYCVDKLHGLRIFEDENEKMNLALADVGGSILLISQFTLMGDARNGKRPSFSGAARPEIANNLYQSVKEQLIAKGLHVETGIFQAHMEVSLTNDGPVTILLDSKKGF